MIKNYIYQLTNESLLRMDIEIIKEALKWFYNETEGDVKN